MGAGNDIRKASDTELVARFHETRDKEIIGELFTRYTSMVFGVCMKYFKNEDEAKDGVMQVFEKVLNDLHRHQVENFKGWLYMVAKNQCLMYFRSRKIHVELPKNLTGGGADDSASGDSEDFVQDHGGGYNMEWAAVSHLSGEDKEKQLTLMENAIGKLKANQKICIELFYLKEYSYEEVAKQTGFSMKEVKSYIQNGKRNLKILMTGSSEAKSS